MTSVAVIVCGHTLDRWEDITNALESVQRQTRPPDQLILSVDNNDELYHAATATFSDVTVVQNIGRRGVSATRNTAAEMTDCDVLAYLDDDAVADEKWLERLVGWYEDSSIVGVGGHAEPAWDGQGPSWFPSSFNWVVGCSHSGIAPTPSPVRNFIGCNMSIRRQAWSAVGGFDESIGRVGADGGGGDETDFCIRITEVVGGTFMNDPDAIVKHRVPAERQTWSYFLKRCRSEGRSKAQIAAQSGTDRALQAERGHLLHELPRALLGGLGDAIRGDLSGLGRSTAIVFGTTATGFGYLAGRLSNPSPAQPVIADFAPVETAVIDLDDPDLSPTPTADAAIVAVRRSGELLGVEHIDDAAGDELVSQLQAAYPPIAVTEAAPVTNTVAVVLATRDRTDSLRRTLESLRSLRHRPDQIIVVDNAPSTDETKQMITDWDAPELPPIDYVLCERPGLAVAHNASIDHLVTDLAAFTDDDVIVDEYWLDHVMAGFETSDTIACVTGAILPAEIETWPQAWVESTSNFTKGFSSVRYSASTPPDDPLFPFAAGAMGSGANMSFRVNWLREHPFHESLGVGTKALGGDDLRAFYDVIASQHDLVFNPSAVVFHHHHRTAEAIDRQARGYGAGLTAFLTSVVVDNPLTLIAMIRRALHGLRRARSIGAAPRPAAEASVLPTMFPGDRARTWRQRRGMLSGPFRYLRSRF